MRAITVRQPWAWAIIHGGKDVENRVSNIAGAYRGPVAIHAGRTWDRAAFDHPILGPLLRERWHLTAENYTGTDLGGSGVVLGVPDLTDVHWSGMECPRGLAQCHEYALCSEWGQAYQHHLALANPRPLATPVPAKGRLGLWTLPDDVEAAVVAQLGGAA